MRKTHSIGFWKHHALLIFWLVAVVKQRCKKGNFSLSGKNTLRLKFAAHSHVVTWETKREPTTKTKHSINTLRVVPSLHSKWAFTLVRLSYAESKTVSFMTPKSFGVDPNLRKWRVGEKNSGRRWLCYCLAVAVANKATTKKAACSHTAARFPNLKIHSEAARSRKN